MEAKITIKIISWSRYKDLYVTYLDLDFTNWFLLAKRVIKTIEDLIDVESFVSILDLSNEININWKKRSLGLKY